MTKPVPAIAPEELASRLDQGEPLQVLDIRSADRVRRGHIGLGQGLEFHNVKSSTLLASPTLHDLGIDTGRPVAVVCGHGNSSQRATTFLRDHGVEAYSVRGGMAAWETVYVARALTATASIDRAIQLDRIGKGALSYVLASAQAAVVVDPGRHLDRYEAVLKELDARPVAVIDTHMHADYLSGGRAAAGRRAASRNFCRRFSRTATTPTSLPSGPCPRTRSCCVARPVRRSAPQSMRFLTATGQCFSFATSRR